MKKAAIIIVVFLAVVFSIVTQRSSKWKPIKTLHLTKESFQNKNTSAQSRLGEHGPLIRISLNRGSFYRGSVPYNLLLSNFGRAEENRPLYQGFRYIDVC